MALKRRDKKNDTSTPSDEFTRFNSDKYVANAGKKRVRKHVLRAVLIACVIVIAGGAAAAWAWMHSINSRMQNSNVITSELKQALSENRAPSDPYYMLLLGTDGRPGEEEYRADSIILAYVMPKQKKISLLSIPRDTKIVYKGSTMKINAAHFYDGAAGMVTAVETLTGVEISHYAEVNFDGLANLTDALGGVWVDVDQSFTDTENFDDVTHLDAGYQKLNGAQALFYTRVRYAFSDGDFTRMRHQRTFIMALIKQALSDATPASVINTVNSVADMVITDLSVDQIIGMATEFIGINVDSDIYSANIPADGAMIDGQSYLIVNQALFKPMLAKFKAGEDPSTVTEESLAASQKESLNGGKNALSDTSTTDSKDAQATPIKVTSAGSKNTAGRN